MDRRQFLKRGAFFTVAAAAGTTLVACGGNEDTPSLYEYPQGIASGDPHDTSVVFWTRCVPKDGSDTPVTLTLQVSASATFYTLLAHTELQADSTYDHTVRAKITGLPSATQLYYRFVAGIDKSPVGTAKTAPAAGADVAQVKFAWFTCQD